MSHDETATPTPRILITPSTTPAPPWAGVKFTCFGCKAEYQLEAADYCTECGRPEGKVFFITPPCRDCGKSSIITVAVVNQEARKTGKEESAESGPRESADEFQEGNPS